MISSSNNSIDAWLKKSQSIRQARLDKLLQFESHIETRSTTPTEIRSPFLQKYEYAHSKLDQLQQQLNDIRISPPSSTSNKRQFISEKEEFHSFPMNNRNIPPSHTQSEILSTTYNSPLKRNNFNKINKSQSTTTLSNNNILLKPLKLSKHSNSHESILITKHSGRVSISTSDDTNPYTMNDIHPSLMNKLNTFQSNKSNNSSTVSIRSKLIHQSEKQKENMRQSLMHLESKSDLHSRSGSISIDTTNSSNKFQRKSPRKLSPVNSPNKKSIFSKNNYKPNVKLSVSFANNCANKRIKSNDTINRVRQSIIFEHSQSNIDDKISILSPPLSPTFQSPKSPIYSHANSVITDDDKRSDISTHSILSPNSIMSRRSTVYDLVDESERIIEDKQSNINTYRQSVLFQLNHAESKKKIILKERENNNIAIQFFKNNLKRKIIIIWKEYMENEIDIGYKYRQHIIKIKCWNEWKRMYLIVRIIKKRKYINIWKNINYNKINQIHQLLKFPTKARWKLLKIISIMRLSRNSFSKQRYKIIVNKLFSQYGIIIIFVFFASWRTLAQQRNIAAFNIIKMIKKSDKNTMIRNLRIWKYKTKSGKLKRYNSFNAAKKLHLKNIHKRYLKNWMSVFIHESLIKIALFHWCDKMEQNIFNKWINYTKWSIKSKIKSDKLYNKNICKKYFIFWIDEMIRIQNEKQWKAWRDANKSINNVSNNDDKKENRQVIKSYLCNVNSIDPPQNLFFPYYGLSNSQIKNEINTDSNSIFQKRDDRLSYVKHCELKQILIPTYDPSNIKSKK